jgi:fibronectin-binding autotransporter adhesin
VTLNQNGVLVVDDSSGTYASPVTRATGVAVSGGAGFSTGPTASELANLVVRGSASGATNDAFGPLALNVGPLFGKLIPNPAFNLTLSFDSLSRSRGTQWNFGHPFNGTNGLGTVAIGTGANTGSVVITAPPTASLSGGGGSTGTATVSILPFVFVANQLSTYDTTYGLRSLASAETTTTLTSGTSTLTNVQVSAAATISAATTVNALYLTAGGSINGPGKLTLASGALVADQSFNIGNTTPGVLDFGSAEGNVNVANVRVLTISDLITGRGGLTCGLEDYNATTAELVLNAANTFTGITTLSGNNPLLKVVLNNGLALQNSTLDYNNYGAALQFGGTGTTGVTQGNVTSATFGGLTGAQALALTNSGAAGGAVALTVGGDGDSTTYSGVLSGTGGLTKIGVGTLILTGANTYTGATAINGGTLLVDGSLAAGTAVAVNSGGALGGAGTVGGAVTVAHGGALAPGSGGIATLSIAGRLTLNAGSILNLDLGSTSVSDELALASYTGPATGTVTINLTALSGFGAGTYQLMTGASGINAGSFAIGTAPFGYTYTLSVSGTSLSLAVTVTPPSAPTGLIGVGGNAQASLSWNAVAGVTGYNVKRSTDGTTYAIVGANVSAVDYTDSGLTNTTTYDYVVTALKGVAESANSNVASVRPAVPITPGELTAPVITVASAGGSSVATTTVNASVTGHTYQLQFSPTLAPGSWQNLGAAQSGNGGSLQFTATLDSTVTVAFFRMLISN